MKKWFIGLLFLVMLAVGATGCSPSLMSGGDNKADYEVSLSVDKDVKETIRILIPSNDGDLEKGYIDALKPGFKELYPNVDIVYDSRIISNEKYAETIGSAIASKNIPDLFYTNTVFYYYLIAKKCIVNLEPYYKAEKEAGTLDLAADYYESFFNMSMYEGKRYVVPRTADSVVCYINTKILQDVGIEISGQNKDTRLSNDWTWEDLVSLCKQCSDYFKSPEGKNSGYGDAYAIQADFDWEAVFNALMVSYGAKVFDDNGNVAIDSPETKTMANMLRSLANEGRIVRTSTTQSSFMNGKCAFYFSSNGPSSIDKYASISGKFDFYPFPAIGENPAIGCGFAGWGISNATSGVKRDLCWQFLKYMISKEGQMAFINECESTVPSVRIDISEKKSWGKGFENLNLDAFLVHADTKVSSKFFIQHDPKYTFDIMTSIQDFIRNLLENDNKSVDWCIGTCSDKLTEVISKK